ncbi:MAG TPA: hypothetical protein VFI30_02960 [Nocardioidaceae bacterium]|nr:hypothetical protein [Nocardioidaceae bacterium]
MTAALRYEWVRIRTIASTFWMSGLAIVLTAGVCAVLAWRIDVAKVSDLTIGEASTWMVTGGASAPVVPVLGALFYAVMGAMTMGHEFRYGTNKATLAAVPGRLAVVGAKAAVLSAWVICVAVVTLAVDAAIVALMLPGVGIDSSLWRPAAEYLGYCVGFALAGMSIAAVLRSQVGAIVTVLLWPLLIEPVAGGIMRVINVTTHADLSVPYSLLPATAGRRSMYSPYTLLSSATGGVDTWGLGESTVIFWVAIALLVAAGTILFAHRDA